MAGARTARLTVFLGAGPGPAVAQAMLAAVRRLPPTGVMIELGDLELAAVLPRRPTVVAVDDLASRQDDVRALLDAGIDVLATVHAAQVESLADAAQRITGLRHVRLVPDALLERADEVRFVDGGADAESDADHIKLLALRELALRRAADLLEAIGVRVQGGAAGPPARREAVVACIGPSPGSERLVRAARRIAQGMRAPWYAVHVDVLGTPPMRAEDHDRVEAHLALAESLGAEVMRPSGSSVAEGVLRFAREHGVTRIVAGKPTHARWRDRLRGSLLDDLIRGSQDIEVHVIAPVDEARPARSPRPATRLATFLPGVVAVMVATVLGIVAGDRLSKPDHAMLYLAAIMLAALRGRGSGLLAATLSVAAFDFFFIEPYYRLAVAEKQHLVTFTVMFIVGTSMGTLVARLRHAETASRQRERRTSALLAFTTEAAVARDAADVAAAVVAHVEDVFAAPTVVLVPGPDGALAAVAGLEPLAAQEIEVARWAHEHRRAAGRGTEMRPDARLLAVPLWVGDGSAGVVAVQIDRARKRIDHEARVLLEAIARNAGVAIARLSLASEARAAALRAQTEELRSSLLSTVSHDLRTPLAIITGMASTVRESATSLTPDERESLDAIVDEARRLGQILTNLLAITRVESGATLRREWVPVEELVGSALGRTESVLGDRPIAIDIAQDSGVLVDPILTEQMLINLLENAAKHTPTGSAIEIRGVRSGEGVTIEISDHGPGLPPGPTDQVFQKFFRGPETRTAGAGLGLAVCRGIAVAHGGTIDAVPREAGGATFRIWLPGGDAPTDDAA